MKNLPMQNLASAASVNAAPPYQASFRPSGSPLGLFDDILPYRYDKFGGEVWLRKGPSLWLRVIPLEEEARTFEVDKIRAMANSHPLLMPLSFDSMFGDIFHIRAEDGYGAYTSVGNQAPQMEDLFSDESDAPNRHIDSRIFCADLVSFVFSRGEVWGVDAHSLSTSKGKGIPPIIEKHMQRGLAGYGDFLKRLGIKPPFRWIAGMEGIEGEPLCVPTIPHNYHAYADGVGKCEVDSLCAEGWFHHAPPVKVLAPLFRLLYESCNVDRPKWLDGG